MNISPAQAEILLKRLQSFDFLRGFDQETIASLAASAIWKIYPQDSVIFCEGNSESNLFSCNKVILL